MEELQLILQFPALAGLIILWMWNRAQRDQISELQSRLDRVNERQQTLFDRALRKTDLKDTDH